MNREAIQFRAPSAARPPHVQAFTSSSTAAVAVGVTTECGDADGGWYTFVPTEDCHIIWGTSSVSAATTSDMFYPAGVSFSIWLSRKLETHMRILRNSADGNLHWHKSES